MIKHNKPNQILRTKPNFFCVFVPFNPHINLQVHTQTHKPDQTKININGFDMAKSAAQLLYGPVLVSFWPDF